MNKKGGGSYNQSRKPQVTTPVTYPELKKNMALLDRKYGNRSQIAKHSIDLLNKRKTSIYKKLFNRLSNKDTSFNAQEIRTIRNLYLKRLVESNAENFPIELSYEEYKANVIAKEDKVKTMLLKMKEAGKNEKIKKDPLDLSRNSSLALRRESIDEQIMRKEKSKSQHLKKTEPQAKPGQEPPKNKEDTEDENIEEEGKEQEQSYENDNENYINDNMDDDSQNANYEEEGDMDEGGEF